MKNLYRAIIAVWAVFLFNGVGYCSADLDLLSEEIVKVFNTELNTEFDLNVGDDNYSVPSLADWNSDGLADMIVGQGNSSGAKVRVYLNIGDSSRPKLDLSFYAQSGSSDLTCHGWGCMGCFPRVVYWDGDDRKDLLVGEGYGTIKIFLNVGTETEPVFDNGNYLQVGEPGLKYNINVGGRATSSLVDWNNDGVRDLVCGAISGKIFVFINAGTDNAPDYRKSIYVQTPSGDLIVASLRSSPVVIDLDNDGRKDILTGNTNGELLFYSNIGTEAGPMFSSYSYVDAAGVKIDLASTPRSRPSVCDWTGDGQLDVLIGAKDGLVRLYQGRKPGDIDGDHKVDLVDFGLLSTKWLTGGCSYLADNNFCDRADIDKSGSVGAEDLGKMTANWLTGVGK